MAASGVLAQVLPGAEARFLAPLVHLEGSVPPDPLRRLAPGDAVTLVWEASAARLLPAAA